MMHSYILLRFSIIAKLKYELDLTVFQRNIKVIFRVKSRVKIYIFKRNDSYYKLSNFSSILLKYEPDDIINVLWNVMKAI